MLDLLHVRLVRFALFAVLIMLLGAMAVHADAVKDQSVPMGDFTSVDLAAQTTCSVTAARDVNKRRGPGTGYRVVGNLAANTPYPVIGETTGEDGYVWFQVGDGGWVRSDVVTASGDCLTPGSEAPQTSPPEQPAPVGSVNGTNATVLNVRNGPSTNAAQLGQLPAGSAIGLNGRWGSGGTLWVRFDFNGQPAWVAGWLLNISGDPNTLPDMEAAQNVVLGLCAGGAAAEAPAYNAVSGLHPILLINDTGGRHAWDRQMGQWGAGANLASAQLVACLSPEQSVEIQTCSYYGPSIVRYAYQIDVRLIAAQSGQVIATTALRGNDPRECRNQEPYNLVRLDGSRVSFDQLRTWLQPYVSP